MRLPVAALALALAVAVAVAATAPCAAALGHPARGELLRLYAVETRALHGPESLLALPGVTSLAGMFHSLAVVSASARPTPSAVPVGDAVSGTSPYLGGMDAPRTLVAVECTGMVCEEPAAVTAWANATAAAVAAAAKDGVPSVRLVARVGRNILVDVATVEVDGLVARVAAASSASTVLPLWSWPEVGEWGPSPAAAARLAALVADVPNPIITQMIEKVDTGNLKASLQYLSGVTSGLITRNSFSTDAVKAADWLKAQMEGYGYDVELMPFKTGYAPNVVATIQGKQDAMVVLGAHYDSRSADVNSPTNPAPGADDDGSGTAALLEVARILATTEVEFEYSITVVFFCGEEQGLVGSAAMAAKLKADGADVVAMLQNDMQAYRPPGADIEIALMERGATPILNEAMAAVYALYFPNVRVCYTAACCSDQQSFSPYWPAAAQFETCSPAVIDPAYHSTDDIINRPGFDIEGELATQTKALVATSATFLGAIL